MEQVLAIIFIVFGVLQIILFFKIWGMTNDVSKIKEAFLRESNNPLITEESDRLKEKAIVIKSSEVVFIRDYDKLSKKYVCYSENNEFFVGLFSSKEIEIIPTQDME